MPEVFEKLQELILDENKVVTYKTLCRTLHMPANKAKQYLSDFFDKYAATHDLSASYILIGLSSDKKLQQQCTRIAVVSGHELDKVKKEFSSISSMHVYAVHKGKLLDENILFNTDYEKMNRVEDYNRFSRIRNPNIYVQAEQQVKHVFIPKDLGNVWKPNPPSNQSAQKNDNQKAPATKSKAPNVFSMFQKKNEDQKNQPKVDTAQVNDPHQESPPKNKKPSPVQNKSSKGSSTKNDVKYFFAKQAEKPPKSQVKKEEPVANLDARPNEKEKERSKAIKEIKSSPETNKSSSRHSSKRAKSEKSKPSRSKAKRTNADDSDEDFVHAKKKHRRIVTMDSDSESENEQEMDRAQRELFDSHPAPTASAVVTDSDEDIIPPTQPVANGKKKIWKVVTKTYEDEDGFFVTKKEKEFVTDSEEDNNENPVKVPAKKKESPKVSPTKKKQSSLMNFFKQK